MDGAPVTSCTSPVDYPSLSKGLHTLAVRATVHGGAHGNAAQWVWRSQGTGASVHVSDTGFSPAVEYASRGSRVSWSFTGPSDASVTDTSGMGLFDSGKRAPGTSFAFIPSGRRELSVRERSRSVREGFAVSPANGTVSASYRITWAVQAPPASGTFQVQVRRPGKSNWSDWIRSSSDAFGIFDASDPLWSGKGVYGFRARYVDTSTGAASQYSGVRSIDVT
jgi:hypothetical protein